MKRALRILRKVFIYTGSFVLLLSITGYVYLYVLPKGPDLTQVLPLKEGNDSFVIYAYNESKRKSIKVHTYKPNGWQSGNPIVFVMHGGGRNADDYRDAWVENAKAKNLLIVAPEFENKFSNITTNDYQEGNLYTFFGSKNDKEEWAYTVVENIFDHIKSTNKIENETYSIFGHSAGGQFVHRMVMLMPEARIDKAIAANAGFYSFPDEQLKFPYGIKNTGPDVTDALQAAYRKRLVILLGELDNDPELGIFRTTPPAMEQGGHRLERGTNFYQANVLLSKQKGWAFHWEIDTVKNVGHDFRKMSKSALQWIEN